MIHQRNRDDQGDEPQRVIFDTFQRLLLLIRSKILFEISQNML